jgi:hypothetical protein
MPWLRHRPIQTTHLLVLIFLTCCLSFSSATIYLDEQMVETLDDGSDPFGSAYDDGLALPANLLVDPSYPIPKEWTLENLAEDLRRRDEAVTTASTSSTSSSPKPTGTTTLASTTTSSGLVVSTPLPTSQLPEPFDLGFSNNLTTSCQNFMNNMLQNSTFKTCLPFSLLLQVWLISCPSLSWTVF